MYEQHPVPQQISSYSFKLVGNMTLKQFFQVAGGAIVALILYAIPLPAIVKWPLIIISAISGAAFAFLPIQNRPLEQWLAAFFRSIYSPTIFVWDKDASNHNYFKVDQIMAVNQTPVVVKNTPPALNINPVAVNKTSNVIYKKPIPLPVKAAPVNNNDLMPKGEMIGQYQGQITSDSLVDNKPKPAPVVQKKQLVVPVAQRIQTERVGFQAPTPKAPTRQVVAQQVGQVFKAAPEQATNQAVVQFSKAASPPIKPEVANTLVGQILDSKQDIIEGAILEVKDKLGIPVRAMKTNKAGHFMMVTPLADGIYNILTEKEGFIFQPVSVELKGNIVEPIVIKSQ